jgi:hypothetical protein
MFFSALFGRKKAAAGTARLAPASQAGTLSPEAQAMHAREAARQQGAKDAQQYGATHSVPAVAQQAAAAKAAGEPALTMPEAPDALRSASEAQLGGLQAAMKQRRKFSSAEGVLGPKPGRRSYTKAATTTLKAGGGY